MSTSAALRPTKGVLVSVVLARVSSEVNQRLQEVEGRRQNSCFVKFQHGIYPVEGPLSLRHGLVLLVGAVHDSNQQIYQKHIADQRKRVEQAVCNKPDESRGIFLELLFHFVVKISNNRPERPGQPLLVPLSSVWEEDRCDCTTEPKTEDDDQCEELQGILGHAKDCDE
eukprot:CAMPEP_0197676142 /NCGR_PEP_ID=MMETSP1338-20131121/86257_1 /TAXON_ID=43686 ORGANISM="Pelagodinium beii, Strain RCC1491" /NCGR_SAMPLE_ID=MMETSP1338 /ASSEMBLY_ACC=CAM_ASM_000754 /LENGTH=168 /DNA_ID=CAMNT_0043256775 /DNA_START=267 /DNA_END=773 /DNA_ORIENTATION=-